MATESTITPTTTTPTPPVTTVVTPAELDSYKRQVSTMMVEGNGGLFALCMNPNSPDYGNLMFKHEGLNVWKRQRAATAPELASAKEVLERFKTLIAP